jgi:hypothetical protein
MLIRPDLILIDVSKPELGNESKKQNWSSKKVGKLVGILIALFWHAILMHGYYDGMKYGTDELMGLAIFYFPIFLIIMPFSPTPCYSDTNCGISAFIILMIMIGGLWYMYIGSLIGSGIGAIIGYVLKDESDSLPVYNEKLNDYLKQAEFYGNSGDFEKATELLEEAVKMNPSWSVKIAGDSNRPLINPQSFASGYGLLMYLSSNAGRKDLSLEYFKRMLELNPKHPELAREAARASKISKEAKIVAKEMGVAFYWYDM